MLNKKGSEGSMGNASNYLLSAGALVCALGTNGPTNPGKHQHPVEVSPLQATEVLKREDFLS